MNNETSSRLDLIKRFEKATKTQKAVLIEFFGEDFFKVDITDRVKSFEDACEVLDRIVLMPDVSMLPAKDQKSMIAYYKLMVIVEALNEGWKISENDYGYYPWWYIDFSGGYAAFGSADANCAPSCATTDIGGGFRLRFKTRSLALYAAWQFKNLYEDFILA